MRSLCEGGSSQRAVLTVLRIRREGRIARMYGPEDRILNGDYKFPDPTMVK